ncbi:extracellular lipase, putative [Metarhizium acridum CQMa 102]|uniref:Extracellular lipase, putative n=1 Tax=Metarhizium acridum (strain CQMa 102) TaxID=655827 RepID=E9EH96_METAQ|nr:extracellular lipase, putative [Metarhizium acridum CQMa 102]EFY84725.1 extracellular lipase, putative [Metarhizium acridum CQMa 102]
MAFLARPDGKVVPLSPEELAATGRYYAEGTVFSIFQRSFKTNDDLANYLSENMFANATKEQLLELIEARTVTDHALIPKCIQSPAHCFHPPPLDRPVRIQIEGPLVSIQKLLPEVPWHVDVHEKKFQQAGAELAELTYRTIYGHDVRPFVENDMIVRDEYLGWVHQKK